MHGVHEQGDAVFEAFEVFTERRQVLRVGHLGDLDRMLEAGLVVLERHQHGEYLLALLHGGHEAIGERFAVA